MDLKILKEEKSALPRKELEAVLKFDQETPSRQSIKDEVAKKVKADEKLVIIKKIQTYFGVNEAKITAVVYDNEEAMKSLEFKKMIEKHNKPEPKKEEKPAEEAPKAETPVEEKKEEAPKEEKPAEEKKEEALTEEKKEEAPKEGKKGEE